MRMKHQGGQRGFTLIEILVAMTILAIIILIVSGIFHQSSTAWEAGTRKTELNMEGRAAINLMAEELSHAVAGFYTNNLVQGTAIYFWTFGSATNGERVARKIWYTIEDGVVKRLCQTLNPDVAPYPSFLGGASNVPFVANVSSPSGFKTPDGAPFRGSLPAWIDIELSLSKSGTYSMIKAWSRGPDGASVPPSGGPTGVGGDDVRSWESTP